MKSSTFSSSLLTAAVSVLLGAPAIFAGAQTASSAPIKNVVLVHGAWADGSSWSKIIPLLQAKGLHVTAVQTR